MTTPTLPSEESRLAALAGYGILDTAREPAFDDLTELAAHICEAPIALITLVDANRLWLKSRVGLDASETARSISFCTHAIRQTELFVVPDTSLDERFANNPLVTALPKIRFYAGAPLINAEGHALGTLCVIDRVPRVLSPDQEQALRILSRHVMAQLELRRQTLEISRLKAEQLTQTLIARAVEANERRYRLLFERNPHPMWIYDVETLGFLAVNDAACDHYGYTRDEFLAMTIRDIRPTEELERLQVAVNNPTVKGATSGTFRHRTKTGARLTVEVTDNPIDWCDRPAKLVLAVDVSQRRSIDEARSRLATAVEQAAESIIISNVDGVIEYVNPAFESITGYTKQEAVGKNTRLLKSGRQDVTFYDELWTTLARGESWQGRIVNKRKDGTFYDAEMSISPIRNQEGRVVNYVAVQRDITREVALETQLRHTQKLETLGQLASAVAHDLNNILTVVQGNVAELLGDRLKATAETASLLEIAEASERAAKLTRQLLVFSRKEAIRLAPLDCNYVILHLAPMLQRLLGKSIKLESELSASIPSVLADRGMIEQVLVNFVVNARDAMANGGHITIRTSAELIDEDALSMHPNAPQTDTYTSISVRDTGSGIARENFDRIFEPFFTTKESGRGTGLGLATVFDIVKQHRGFIEVESDVGSGTVFRVYLPAVFAPLDDAQGYSLETERLRGSEGILVVEDDPTVQRLVGRVLTRFGYRLFLSHSGADALEVFAKHGAQIDLLFTDVGLSGAITGSTLAKQLLALKPSLKVLYTSALGVAAGTTSSPPMDADCVRKPWLPRDLVLAIRARLDRS